MHSATTLTEVVRNLTRILVAQAEGDEKLFDVSDRRTKLKILGGGIGVRTNTRAVGIVNVLEEIDTK